MKSNTIQKIIRHNQVEYIPGGKDGLTTENMLLVINTVKKNKYSIISINIISIL